MPLPHDSLAAIDVRRVALVMVDLRQLTTLELHQAHYALHVCAKAFSKANRTGVANPQTLPPSRTFQDCGVAQHCSPLARTQLLEADDLVTCDMSMPQTNILGPYSVSRG